MNNDTPNENQSFTLSSIGHKILESATHILPEVTPPQQPQPLKKKLMWSGLILAIYIILGEITVYGVTQNVQDYFSFFQAVLASRTGTLITLGIGPVVTAGIFMQLFQGAEIFNFDLASHQGRAQFQIAQKTLAYFLCFAEAGIYIAAGAFGNYGLGRDLFLILQVGLGASLIVLMDEVVTKWGFGSGISLFIAGGVARDIVWKLFSPYSSPQYGNQMIGAITSFIQSLFRGNPLWLRAGLPDMVQVLFTIVVFLVVVYFETLWLEVPLSSGRFRGIRGGYPVKFIYASVIPVIFTMATFGTFGLVARIFSTRFGVHVLGVYNANGTAVGGLMYYLTSPRDLFEVVLDPLRAFIYLILVVVFCALFALLWTDIAGMGSKAIAQKIQQSGTQVAGFQRDIRVIESVLNRYIPQATVLGGITVGFLAVFANFTNALGTGTGILLAVSILYRMYLDLIKDPDLPMSVRKALLE
jgi:preprotein translocase subunit SecY